MKDARQIEFIELNRLVEKFSIHLDRSLVKALFAEYKKLLTKAHYEMPASTFFREKIKSMSAIEEALETADPGTVKLHLQNYLSEIVSEMDIVNSESGQ